MHHRHPQDYIFAVKVALLAGLAFCPALALPQNVTAKEDRQSAPASKSTLDMDSAAFTPALKLVDQGKHSAAIAWLTAFIAKHPTNAAAYCRRAIVWGVAKNTSAALKDLERASALAPQSTVPHCLRGAMFYTEDRLNDALAEADKALVLDPKAEQPYLLRAFVHELQNKANEVVEDCNKVLSINPKNYEGYLTRAVAYRRLKQYNLSLADSNTAVKLNPGGVKDFIERGFTNKSMGRLNPAILDYTVAITNASAPTATSSQRAQLPEAYVLRSETYAALKQNDKAIADLSAAIKLTPKDLTLVKQRGHAYYNTSQYQKALDDYNLFIQKSPARADYLTWRAHTYDQLGQHYNQITDYTDAIDLHPYLADLWQSRAYALYKVGLLDLALDDCKVSDTLEPSNTSQSYTASYIHEDRGEYLEALKYRAKILEREKKSAFAWSSSARLNQALGNLDKAGIERVRAHELATAIERAEIQCCHALFDFTNPAPQQPEQSISNHLKADPVVLPFHYDSGQHICVPATINGHRVELMLDTGCGHSDLWEDKVADIAKLEETKLTGTMASGKEFKYGFVKVKEMKLGTLPLTDLTLSIQKGLPAHKTLSGFLGGNILEHMAVTIDYQAKTVTLNPSAKYSKSDKAIVVPIMVRNHQPLCMITVDDQIERMALLDTGCPQGMAPSALLKPILKSPLTYDESINGPWLGELQSKEVRLKSISLGTNKFSDFLFDVFKEDGAVNAAHEITLGNDLLSCFKSVTFDYAARQLILEPREGQYRSGMAIYNEARRQLKEEQYKKSIELFDKSVALEPGLAEDVYYYRAKAHLELKQYKSALDDLNACIKIEPKAPWAYYQRARVHDHMQNYQKEIDDLTTSIRLDPDYKFAFRNRAEAYEKIGRKDLAKRDRKLAGKD